MQARLNSNFVIDKKASYLLAITLTLLGLFFRLWTIRYTYPWPGDPQARTVVSMRWLADPHWVRSGYWLPAPCYLNALALAIFHDPLNATRIVSAILGALAIPILYAYTLRLFGSFTAIVSTTVFVFLPIDVGLSASGLTDAWGLTFTLLSFHWLMKSVSPEQTRSKQNAYVAGVILSSLLLNTTRAESWGFIPLMVGYYFWRTKRWLPSALMFVCSIVVPIYWLANCYLDYHLPLVSFSGSDEQRVVPYSVPVAALTVLRDLLLQLGPVIFVAGSIGLVLLFKSLVRERKTDDKWQEKAFYLAVVLYLLIGNVRIAMVCGIDYADRYALLLMVMWIPLAANALAALPYFARKLDQGIELKKKVVATLIATLLTTNSVVISFFYLRPDIWLSKSKPEGPLAVAEWLRKSGNAGKSIVCTGLDYQVFYIILYCPEVRPHFQWACNFFAPFLDIRDALAKNPPELLIVGKRDEPDIYSLKHVISYELEQPPVFQAKDISVYRIVPNSFHPLGDDHPPYCIWYPQPSWKTLFQKWKRRPDPPEL